MTSKRGTELPKGAGVAFLLLLFCSGVALLFGVGWLITAVMNWLELFPYKLRGFSCQWQPEPGCLTIIDAPTSFLGYLVTGVAGCIVLLFSCVFIGIAIAMVYELAKAIDKHCGGLDKYGATLFSRIFKK
ncbi:hypothetical protein [Photorhabdus sp. SF281]|uniref:hypothetical protein n=1 Tax=Photorhabdus sp. SF281 TaxID=3459527 RepID=UPI0040450176